MKLFGEKLAKQRINLNYTQEQLADLLNVSRQTISKWEANLAYPQISKLPMIASFLEISCDYLLDDELSIEKQPNIKSTNDNITVEWSKIYPVLSEYKQRVNIEKYSKVFNDIFDDIASEYNYSDEDAMLVAKDILANTYFNKIKK
ncbi:transcriptional regulator with XRE-family HTH domain [Bacilli bacterium PM5-3]|nr:transcriptional regulator with XRE-family HTH domain [Bacilli bacterium PM5-3]MDH6603279.1 transcriptional regulator with XRE-family HTH domain [Bacilli bacterium PM5-9]